MKEFCVLFLFPKALKVKRFLLLKPLRLESSPDQLCVAFPHCWALFRTPFHLPDPGSTGKVWKLLPDSWETEEMTWINSAQSWSRGCLCRLAKLCQLVEPGHSRGPWPSPGVTSPMSKAAPAPWDAAEPPGSEAASKPLLLLWVQRKEQLSVVRLRHNQELCQEKKPLLLGKSHPSAPRFCSQTEFLPLFFLFLPWS